MTLSIAKWVRIMPLWKTNGAMPLMPVSLSHFIFVRLALMIGCPWDFDFMPHSSEGRKRKTEFLKLLLNIGKCAIAQNPDREISGVMIDVLRHTVMIAFFIGNLDKLPECPRIAVHNELKEKVIVDLFIILVRPDRIIGAAWKIQILFGFGYNFFRQRIEERKSVLVRPLRDGDDPAVLE